MKLSIITINYNDSQGLEKTIVSVINQTFRDFQYIVIDGNSTDGSREVLEKYDKYIDKWISEPDSGIYNAMNKGASFANGEYLLFLNSGDFLYNNYVLQRLFENEFDQDIVSCACCDFDKERQWVKFPPLQVSLFTFIGGSLSHPSTLIKNDLFIKIGGYHECYKIMSDWCFFVEALVIYNCSYMCYDIVLSKFNCFGISSTSAQEEDDAANWYLQCHFPRIIGDYVVDEAIMNCAYWIAGFHGIRKKIMMCPFLVLNRLFSLRNRLGKRLRIKK